MSYAEPIEKTPGQLVDENDYNLLVNNVIDHNLRMAALQQPDTGAANLAVGSIVLYWGLPSALDEGWAICDGANGTPDLRDRIPVGAGGAYAPGATGGASYHQHSNPDTNNGGNHSHTFSGSSETSYGLSSVTATSGDVVNNPHYHNWSASPDGGVHRHSKPATGSAGHRPPTRALYYIMRVS